MFVALRMGMKPWVFLVCTGALSCSAGSDRPDPSSMAGAASDDGGSSGRGVAAGTGGSAAAADAGALPDSECVVVQVLDCCPVFKAVTRAELEADRCLVALPFGPAFGTDQLCASSSCVGIACKVPPPPSRIAVPDGAGGCRFVDECERDDDCAIGTAESGCCGCPQAMPKALIDANPCALAEGERPNRAHQCRQCTAPIECGECSPPSAPRCVEGDELRVCE